MCRLSLPWCFSQWNRKDMQSHSLVVMSCVSQLQVTIKHQRFPITDLCNSGRLTGSPRWHFRESLWNADLLTVCMPHSRSTPTEMRDNRSLSRGESIIFKEFHICCWLYFVLILCWNHLSGWIVYTCSDVVQRWYESRVSVRQSHLSVKRCT